MGFKKERRPLLTPNNADVTQDLREQFDAVNADSTANASDITDLQAQPVPLDYSTTEQDTGLKWTDAKAIFQKTVVFGLLPDAEVGTTAHNITTIETVVRLEGITSSTGPVFGNLPFAQITLDDISVSVDTTNITINPGAVDRSNETGTFTLWYTKV